MNKNNIEIELKFLLVGSLDELLKKLDGHRERIYQRTVMFDNDQGLMQKINGRIRLRQTGELTTLSYKLPVSSGTVKKEIEWETKIDNWHVGEELLKAMGFEETTSYEKYRTSFEYMGSKIDVDEYPFSTFIEIEGEEGNIKNTALNLGFDMKDNLTESCDTLFCKWREERGLPMTNHMKFESYDK